MTVTCSVCEAPWQPSCQTHLTPTRYVARCVDCERRICSQCGAGHDETYVGPDGLCDSDRRHLAQPHQVVDTDGLHHPCHYTEGFHGKRSHAVDEFHTERKADTPGRTRRKRDRKAERRRGIELARERSRWKPAPDMCTPGDVATCSVPNCANPGHMVEVKS